MDGGYEQSCHKTSLSATETLILVQKAYGNEALNPSNIFRWYSRFWDGMGLVENDERGGRPKSTRSEVNIAAVADLVINDLWIASRMIAESLNIPKTVVLWILKKDLGKRNLCVRFVPHSLTPEQREDQVTSCQDIIMMADFFNRIITGDETCCFVPVTPKQSNRFLNGLVRHPLGWRNWNSKPRSCIKTMLIIFLTLMV